MKWLRYMVGILVLIFLLALGGKVMSNFSQGQEITVFAAASLTESMQEIATNFELQQGDIKVNLHFAGSQSLRTQIQQGMRADVFISANRMHISKLEEDQLVKASRQLVGNKMVVIVPVANPAGINSLEDLTKPHKLVVAHQAVPVGAYTRQVLQNLSAIYGQGYPDKVLNNVVSEENNVKQVVSKVVLGEADAAFVYATDVTDQIQKKVRVLSIPYRYNIVASYWVGIVTEAGNKQAAEQFMQYLFSAEGQAVFRKHGFITVNGE